MNGHFGETRIHLTSRRLSESVAFYADSLGLPIVELREKEGDRGAVFAFGPALLEIFEESDRHPFIEPQGVRLSAEVDDVDASFARLVRSGAVPPDPAPCDRPWGHRTFMLHDPNGLPITLFSRLRRKSTRQQV